MPQNENGMTVYTDSVCPDFVFGASSLGSLRAHASTMVIVDRFYFSMFFVPPPHPPPLIVNTQYYGCLPV